MIRKHSHLRVGRYHQHLKDHLDLGLSALKYMMTCYPDDKDEEDMRRSLGMYGLTGKQQVYIHTICIYTHHMYIYACMNAVAVKTSMTAVLVITWEWLVRSAMYMCLYCTFNDCVCAGKSMMLSTICMY